MEEKQILIKGIDVGGTYYPQTHAEAVLGLDEYIPEDGRPGKDGKTWRPSVSEDGLLSWTLDSSSEPVQSVNIKGKDGSDGTNGDPGADGYTYIPSVSKEGVLTWTKTQGNPVTDPGSANIKGKDGKDGKDGTNGKDGTGISLKPSKEECEAVGDAYIATSTTGDEIEGHIYIYNGSVFTDGGEIKGPKGNDGNPGKAATIQVGKVTTVAAGLNAKITNVGSNTDATFDFEIPKGADGTPGTPGGVYVPNVTDLGILTWQYSTSHPDVSSSTDLKGDSATITVGTVTTGNPGTLVIVSNRGTENNAILDFTIPRGRDGQDVNPDVEDKVSRLTEWHNSLTYKVGIPAGMDVEESAIILKGELLNLDSGEKQDKESFWVLEKAGNGKAGLMSNRDKQKLDSLDGEIDRLDGRIDAIGNIGDSGLVLGESSTTAFAGDRGKALETWKEAVQDTNVVTYLHSPIYLNN